LALRERIKTDTAQGLKDSLYLQEQILGLAQFGRSLGNPEYTENTLMALYQSLADSIQTPSANNNPYGELVRQVQTFKAKAIAGMLNGMSTKDLLILDVVLHNPDRPVFFSGMDGEWGMPMDRHYWYGWTIGLDRQGDRASNPDVARHLTDSLVNTVFKFRSLGDPNVNLNEESQEQMLRSHEITLVFNLAEPYLRARQMARLGPVGPFRYENLMSTPYPALDPASLGALKPMVNASMPSLNKYLSLFPTRALGYKFKADAQVLAGDMAGAKKTMEECKSKVDVHWLADCESAAKNLTIASAPAATPGFSGFPGMMPK
jgi:hypothetical protein